MDSLLHDISTFGKFLSFIVGALIYLSIWSVVSKYSQMKTEYNTLAEIFCDLWVILHVVGIMVFCIWSWIY